jgi:hypothetical protein
MPNDAHDFFPSPKGAYLRFSLNSCPLGCIKSVEVGVCCLNDWFGESSPNLGEPSSLLLAGGGREGQRSFNLVVGGCRRHSSVRGSTHGLGLKNTTHQFHSKHMVKAWSSVALAAGPCLWVGKAHVPKHKLRTDSWVVLTGNGSLCMGGCGVRGIFSVCVRMLFLS